MKFECSHELVEMHANYVAELIEKKNFVSVTSGCEMGNVRSCDKSRNWVGVHYHNDLKRAIENKTSHEIGEQCGMSSSGNPLTLGVCAEQHASNNVLKEAFPNENTNFDVSNLSFTQAIRPKGKKVIPPCTNCNKIFS